MTRKSSKNSKRRGIRMGARTIIRNPLSAPMANGTIFTGNKFQFTRRGDVTVLNFDTISPARIITNNTGYPYWENLAGSLWCDPTSSTFFPLPYAYICAQHMRFLFKKLTVQAVSLQNTTVSLTMPLAYCPDGNSSGGSTYNEIVGMQDVVLAPHWTNPVLECTGITDYKEPLYSKDASNTVGANLRQDSQGCLLVPIDFGTGNNSMAIFTIRLTGVLELYNIGSSSNYQLSKAETDVLQKNSIHKVSDISDILLLNARKTGLFEQASLKLRELKEEKANEDLYFVADKIEPPKLARSVR